MHPYFKAITWTYLTHTARQAHHHFQRPQRGLFSKTTELRASTASSSLSITQTEAEHRCTARSRTMGRFIPSSRALCEDGRGP